MRLAGFDNISDVAGVGLNDVIESFAEQLGLPAAKLTLAQTRKLGACRWAAHLGTSALIFGCLVGMLPLLFMDPNKGSSSARAPRRPSTASKEAGKLLEAEECALLVVDRQLDRLHARYKADDGAMRDAYIALSDETVTTTVARTGEVINIADVASSSRCRKMVEPPAYVSSVQRARGCVGIYPREQSWQYTFFPRIRRYVSQRKIKPRSALFMPVFGSDGVVLAVVLAISKRDRARSGGAGAPGAAFFAATTSAASLDLHAHRGRAAEQQGRREERPDEARPSR